MVAREPSPKYRSCLSLILASLLAVPSFPAEVHAARAQASQLKITILEGEGAINNIKRRTAREPVVQVVDENNKPVAGAMVMFALPDSGPSGVFPNGSRSLMAYTNAQGKAIATGLKPNQVAGQFQISVNASYQGVAASAVISQTNSLAAAAAAGAGGAAGGAAAGGISKTLIAILVIAGGAAAAGAAVAATSGNNGSSTPPTTKVPSATISAPGTPTFGPTN